MSNLSALKSEPGYLVVRAFCSAFSLWFSQKVLSISAVRVLLELSVRAVKSLTFLRFPGILVFCRNASKFSLEEVKKTVQGSLLGLFYFDCSDGIEGAPHIFFHTLRR